MLVFVFIFIFIFFDFVFGICKWFFLEVEEEGVVGCDLMLRFLFVLKLLDMCEGGLEVMFVYV